MTEHDQNEHVWFRESIAAALSGGLEAAQRVRFETHAATCDACSVELAGAKELESKMNALFAHPRVGLEDRIIDRLRAGRRRPVRLVIHPAIRHAVTATAAAVLLGGFGYLVVMQEPMKSARFSARGYTQPNPPQFETQAAYDANDSVLMSDWDSDHAARGDKNRNFRYGYQNPYPGTNAAGGGFKLNNSLGSEFSIAGDVAGKEVSAMGRSPVSKIPQSQSEGRATAGKPAQAVRGGTLVLGDVVNINGGVGGAVTEGTTAWFDPITLGQSAKGVAKGPADAGKPPERPNVRSDGPADNKPASGERFAVALAEVAQEAKPPATEEIRQVDTRKIIRNGQMEFEVDRFDAAFAQVSKLVTENGGYVGTTDSEKLPNGKVKGTVIARVPPDRLDTLVLQLRGIGDLKSQKLEAQDISKQYTDLESQLRAAKAMEERLLQIIKEGKGAIKDLLAAEKELGTWREKVEKITGEMRYYDNLVAMSTLHVTLFERDIQTAALATETETIDAGVETIDVEKARADALKAIEEAKGRVIQSDLKRYDAGQFGATIVAEVPPDASGVLLDRIRQIGKVARLDVQRKQTAEGKQNTATNAPPRVEKRDTRLSLSLYNLANVAPRTSSTMQLAAADVEAAYQSIRSRVVEAGGRLISSNITGDRPEQATATLSFDVPTAQADAVMNELRAVGAVLSQSAAENPDVQNVTTEKRGFNVTLVSAAAVPPREVTAMTIELRDVDSAMATMQQSAADAGGRVTEQNMSKQRDGESTGKIVVEAPLDKAAAVIEQAKKLGAVRAATSTKNQQVPASALARARVELTFGTAETIVEPGRGVWATIRNGLSTSVSGLLWSLQLIVIGLCFVLPWALIVWAGWKIIKRRAKPASV